MQSNKGLTGQEFSTKPNPVEEMMIRLAMVQWVIDFLDTQEPFTSDVKDINRYGKAVVGLIAYLNKFFDKKSMTDDQMKVLKEFRKVGYELERIFDLETIRFLANKKEAVSTLKGILNTMDQEVERFEHRKAMDDRGMVDQFIGIQEILDKMMIISLRGHYLHEGKRNKLNKKLESLIHEFDLTKTLTEVCNESR